MDALAIRLSPADALTNVPVNTNLHVVFSAAIDPLTVTDTPEQYRKECDARAEKYLRMVKDAAEAAGVPFAAVHVVHDLPYEAIINTAHRQDCDLIFMASHGRKGMAALLIGSETMKVLTHSKIPVLVCR